MHALAELMHDGSPQALYAAEFWLELEARAALRPSGWLYAGDGADVYDDERDRTADLCLACGEFRTPQGHDPCIRDLPGILGACCGHGGGHCYLDGDGVRLAGPAAARKMRELGGHPPARAYYLDPLLVERHLAAMPDDDTPTLSAATTAAMARLRLVLCHYDDGALTDAEVERELARWNGHLARLSEHDRDAAAYVMSGFVLVLDGLVRSEGDEP
jgi:hypothetical protein